MKIYYIANARIPTNKAHGGQIIKNICAFTRVGEELELVIPNRSNPLRQDPFWYYGERECAKVHKLFTFDIVDFMPPVGFFLQRISFSLSCIPFFYTRRKEDFVLYGRDELTLLLLKVLFPRRKIFFELHDWPERHKFFWRRFFASLDGILSTNQWKLNELKVRFGLSGDKLLLARNAVDPAEFVQSKSKIELRKELDLDPDNFIYCYVGQLHTKGMAKGLEVITSLARVIEKKQNLKSKVLIVGVETTGEVGSITYVGQQPRAQAIAYMQASDLLLMPFPNTAHYNYYMSPIKMFEYMASGTPILTTDLVSIREVLSSDCAVLVSADKDVFVDTAIKVASEPESIVPLGIKAKELVLREYTLEKRVAKILEFISRCINRWTEK